MRVRPLNLLTLLFVILILTSPSVAIASDADVASGFAAVQKSDFVEAKRLFTKAMSEGNSKGAMLLGQMYSEGWGVDVDPTRAFELYCTSYKMENASGSPESAAALKVFVDSYARDNSLDPGACH
jgi:TPR repeat protein